MVCCCQGWSVTTQPGNLAPIHSQPKAHLTVLSYKTFFSDTPRSESYSRILRKKRIILRKTDAPAQNGCCHAEADGCSQRTAYALLARFSIVRDPSLANRRRNRGNQRWTLDPRQQQQAVGFRHQCCTLRRIAKAVNTPLSTLGRVMQSLGLERHNNLEPKWPVVGDLCGSGLAA